MSTSPVHQRLFAEALPTYPCLLLQSCIVSAVHHYPGHHWQRHLLGADVTSLALPYHALLWLLVVSFLLQYGLGQV